MDCGPGRAASDRCVICVDRHGENTIVSLIDAARGFDPLAETALERWIAPGDWVVLQGNLRASVTRACLALAKSKNATTALNPSPTFPASTTTGAWSTSSFSIAAKRSNSAAAAIRSRRRARSRRWSRNRRGDAWRGGIGARLGRRDPACERAPRVAAVDTVGAGDVFCGTLVAARAKGLPWVEALGAATRAAAICVTRAGVLASFPTRDEMADILPRRLVAERRT